MKMKKGAWIAVAVIIVACLVAGIWRLKTGEKVAVVEDEAEPARNINVAALSGDEESQIKTVIYAGAKLQGEVANDGKNSVANLETTDSSDGAFNIYYQDLLNRYKEYKVDKKEITKDDALGGKAKVIVAHGTTGTIVVTVWPKTNGMTQIEIVTSADFK